MNTTKIGRASAKNQMANPIVYVEDYRRFKDNLAKGQVEISRPMASMLLQYAVLLEDQDIVRILLEYGADPRAEDNMHSTAISFAISMDQEDILQMFIPFVREKNRISDGAAITLDQALCATKIDNCEKYIDLFYLFY